MEILGMCFYVGNDIYYLRELEDDLCGLTRTSVLEPKVHRPLNRPAKTGTTIRCEIGPDDVQGRIKNGNSRQKATSRILSSNLQDCIIQDSITQRFEITQAREIILYHPTASSIIRHLHHQPRATSWRHHRAPRRPGRRRAPTPEELRQATITLASNLYGPSRVHFSAPLDHPTKTAKIERGATGTPLYSTLRGAEIWQVAPTIAVAPGYHFINGILHSQAVNSMVNS
ncbi:hypothetical protein GEV33_006177 [Tenebrio molitor]|uniref:Uncharacterized protein n=1 Tax=Tenebrio molitor TaxID=7067 RepID=A0A8J6HL02_TENMO|nr:hypothetical protein GEV33_006177 [Tenebrio molitor]